MILSRLTTFLLGKQYVGVEHFSLNNEEKIAFLLIEKKKEELQILQKDIVPQTEDFNKKWNLKLPFFLVINTNQVIQKEVHGVDFPDEKLVYKAFPNLNLDEFYYEVWRLKEKSVVAISRKTYVDELLSLYHKQRISIAGISLGVCSICEIIEYTQTHELFTNNQLICINGENQIITTNAIDTNKTYDINGLAIENEHLLTFSGILRLFLNTTKSTGNSIDYSYDLYENYIQKSFFSKSFKIMISILLIFLVANFFTFSHYYKLTEETSENLLLNESSFKELARVKQRVELKEQKAKNFIAPTRSQSSLLINEITYRVPKSILLSELIFHPLNKKVKNEEPILVQEKTILLTGITTDNLSFTDWIASIEKLKWINQVVITHLGKNDSNITEFSIKLTLK